MNTELFSALYFSATFVQSVKPWGKYLPLASGEDIKKYS